MDTKRLPKVDYFRLRYKESCEVGLLDKAAYYKSRLEGMGEPLQAPKIKRELKEKEYIFNFVGGGWNTTHAKTKRGAIKNASKKYNDKVSQVDVNSFRIWTKADYDAEMRSFN